MNENIERKASNNQRLIRFGLTCLLIGFSISVIGPFGTFSEMSFFERLAYWQLAIVVIGYESLMLILMFFHLPVTSQWRASQTMIITSFIMAFPASFQVHWLNQKMIPIEIPISIFELSAYVLLVLLMIFLPLGKRLEERFKNSIKVTHDKEASNESNAATLPTTSANSLLPDLMELFDTNLKGNLVSITAEDHYIKISTDQENQLVLRRFSDAVKLLKPYNGLQVHRSWWVSSRFIERLDKKQGKWQLIMSNGEQIPVSKTYREEVESLCLLLSAKSH